MDYLCYVSLTRGKFSVLLLVDFLSVCNYVVLLLL